MHNLCRRIKNIAKKPLESWNLDDCSCVKKTYGKPQIRGATGRLQWIQAFCGGNMDNV